MTQPCCPTLTSSQHLPALPPQFLGHDPHQQSRCEVQQQQQQLSGPNLPQAAEPLGKPGPFLLLPPLFSKMDMPVAYGFKDTTAAAAAGRETEDNQGDSVCESVCVYVGGGGFSGAAASPPMSPFGAREV